MKHWWEYIIIKALILIVSSAGVTGALSKDSWKNVIKNFIAGIGAGVVSFIICSTTSLNPTWTLMIVMVSTGFVSSLWPALGDIALKYLKRKGNDNLSNS